MFGILDPKFVPKALEPVVVCGEADGDGAFGTDDELVGTKSSEF